VSILTARTKGALLLPAVRQRGPLDLTLTEVMRGGGTGEGNIDDITDITSGCVLGPWESIAQMTLSGIPIPGSLRRCAWAGQPLCDSQARRRTRCLPSYHNSARIEPSRCSSFRHWSPAPAPTACTPAFAGVALTTRCVCPSGSRWDLEPFMRGPASLPTSTANQIQLLPALLNVSSPD
jgi:hypothetical protein